jgi:hypothetical protein
MERRRPAKRLFTYEEALNTFPFVRDLTVAAVRQIEELVGSASDEDEEREGLEEACSRIAQAWAQEVSALGCEVKGLWLVDWDSGDGYYCWRHPEESIGFFHSYEEGFAGRIPIN